MNTAAIRRPEFISEASKQFGSSTIIVSIEAIKHPNGTYEAFTDNGRESTGVNVFDWALKAEELGCGELLITSIDQEGTGSGFDLDLIKTISESVTIPVIAGGGAGSAIDIHDALTDGKADAVSIGSLLHYNYLYNDYNMDDFTTEGNIEYLKGNRTFTKVEATTLPCINKFLSASGISRRM